MIKRIGRICQPIFCIILTRRESLWCTRATMHDASPTLPRLAIVIPCYNEEAVLPHTLSQLSDYLQSLIINKKITPNSFLYFVDDGSRDNTWGIIATEHREHAHIKGLKLTRNMGHQNALLAGLMGVKNKVDCAVSMDADLQDDVNAIATMLERYHEGFDVVSGVRTARDKDSVFKRLTAHVFYKIMRRSGADIIHNHADFRLINRRVMQALEKFEERNLFLRGIFPLIGLRTAHVYYERQARLLGQPKYTLSKMCSLAWDGMTSFSDIPLKLIMSLGLVSFLMSILMIIWIVCAKVMGSALPGWASIMIPLCFMGGVQLLSIGVIGEYIAKVYIEVKRRPRYIEELELE